MGALWYLAQFCGGTGADWRLLSPLHRGERPAYFPSVKYSNGSGDQGGEMASLNEIYRDVVPSAAFALARQVQAKELLRDANELWALKKHGPAFQLYAAAATLGEPYAYFILGRCYLQGDVVAQDQREALRLLNLAKSKGVSAAATLLAACYANGNAVPKSKEQALALYEEAVSLGDFWALERIAELKQADGAESARDWKRLEDALLDYTLTRTHAHASYLLGLIYLEGRSGKSDPARGLSHLQTARDLGSRVAAERLARLAQAA
jgi:TPR repeat protein